MHLKENKSKLIKSRWVSGRRVEPARDPAPAPAPAGVTSTTPPTRRERNRRPHFFFASDSSCCSTISSWPSSERQLRHWMRSRWRTEPARHGEMSRVSALDRPIPRSPGLRRPRTCWRYVRDWAFVAVLLFLRCGNLLDQVSWARPYRLPYCPRSVRFSVLREMRSGCRS